MRKRRKEEKKEEKKLSDDYHKFQYFYENHKLS